MYILTKNFKKIKIKLMKEYMIWSLNSKTLVCQMRVIFFILDEKENVEYFLNKKRHKSNTLRFWINMWF